MQLAQQTQLGEALGSSPASAVLPRSVAAPLWVSLPLLYEEGDAVSESRGKEILKDTEPLHSQGGGLGALGSGWRNKSPLPKGLSSPPHPPCSLLPLLGLISSLS